MTINKACSKLRPTSFIFQKAAEKGLQYGCDTCWRSYSSKFEFEQHRLSHLHGCVDSTDTETESEDDLPLSEIAQIEELSQKSPENRDEEKLALETEEERLLSLEIPGLEMVSDSQNTDSDTGYSDKGSNSEMEIAKTPHSMSFQDLLKCETCHAMFEYQARLKII